jgi:hypothetical protein
MVPQSDNVTRLAQAGLLEPANLSAEDIALIDTLTNQEVSMVIQIAQKTYGSDAQMVKSADLRTGLLRICFPL